MQTMRLSDVCLAIVHEVGIQKIRAIVGPAILLLGGDTPPLGPADLISGPEVI